MVYLRNSGPVESVDTVDTERVSSMFEEAVSAGYPNRGAKPHEAAYTPISCLEPECPLLNRPTTEQSAAGPSLSRIEVKLGS